MSESQISPLLTSRTPYMGSLRSIVQAKVSKKLLSFTNLTSSVREHQLQQILRNDKYVNKLLTVGKIETEMSYKSCLEGIILSLKKFPENKEIIEKLKLNLPHLKPNLSREDTSLMGTILGENYRKAIKKLDDSPLTGEQRALSMIEAKKTLTQDFKEAKESLKTESVTKTSLGTIVHQSDVNFLKKEFAFTKLKYSRCPQYDSVSGGFAALFAGFIGFLISEKFGIELVDSGDFFIAFMYGIFLGFIAHLFTRLISTDSNHTLPISLNHNKLFFLELAKFMANKLRVSN